MTYNDKFMCHAIDLSRRALLEPGTEPFGAVVVKDGVVVGEGLNHSLAHFDPTSHGEVEAIRDACRRLGTVDLSGAELYTSCEPCAMCVATMEVAGISRLYYASSMAQAGRAFDGLTRAMRHPIDVDRLRSLSGALIEDRDTPSEQHRDAEATSILEAWAGMKMGA